MLGSTVCHMRKDIDDLGELSMSLYDDVIRFIKKVKKNNFPDDIHELIRCKLQIAYLSANPP